METWMWISLWIVQTLVGAVLWRMYGFSKSDAIMSSILIIPNIGVFSTFIIDFLAGVKNKTEEE